MTEGGGYRLLGDVQVRRHGRPRVPRPIRGQVREQRLYRLFALFAYRHLAYLLQRLVHALAPVRVVSIRVGHVQELLFSTVFFYYLQGFGFDLNRIRPARLGTHVLDATVGRDARKVVQVHGVDAYKEE